MASELMITDIYGFVEPWEETLASMLSAGYSRAAAARQLTLKYQTVIDKFNDPDFQLAYRKYLDDVQVGSAQIKARLEYAASIAMDRILEALQIPIGTVDEAVKIGGIALSVLDKAGHGPKNKGGGVAVQINIDQKTGQILATTFNEVQRDKNDEVV